MEDQPEISTASPCVRRCTLDDRDLCVGCGRTLGEILEWSSSSSGRKRDIRANAAARLYDMRAAAHARFRA